MSKPAIALVTGANGEIGRSLLSTLSGSGRFELVTLDLTPLPERCAACLASVHGQHHGPLPARPDRRAPRDRRSCSTSRRCSRRAASVTPSWPTRSTSRARSTSCASRRTSRPASVAAGALPLPELDRRLRPARRRRRSARAACAKSTGTCPSPCTAATSSTASTSAATSRSTTASSARSAGAARLDFRALRFPGPHLRRHGADRRHERLRPRDAARRRAGQAVRVLRGPDARIPFMAMPDAVRAPDLAARRPARGAHARRLQHRRLQRCRPRRSPSACARRSPRPT
jgi:threonine 3-dehydrogenase